MLLKMLQDGQPRLGTSSLLFSPLPSSSLLFSSPLNRFSLRLPEESIPAAEMLHTYHTPTHTSICAFLRFQSCCFISSPFSLFQQKASSERFEPWPRDKMISSFDSRVVCEELVATCNSSPLSLLLSLSIYLSLPLSLCLSLCWHSETACLLHSEHDAGTGKQISVSKLLVVCTHFLCSGGRAGGVGGGVELLFGKEAGRRRRRTRRRRESLEAGDMNEFHSCH